MERIGTDIRKLVDYGIRKGLVPQEDEIFTVNQLLELFGLDGPEESGEESSASEAAGEREGISRDGAEKERPGEAGAGMEDRASAKERLAKIFGI